MSETIEAKLATLSAWIDGSYPAEIIGTELHVRRRTQKLVEEVGEVADAVGGVFGENPRKGVTHTPSQIGDELIDVAVTALGAYESLTGNNGRSILALDIALDRILTRAGLTVPATIPEGGDR